jgi:hypothetical protein
MFPHNVKEDAEFFKRIELEVHQVMAKYSFNARIKKEAHEMTGSVGSGPPSLLQATSMVSSADSHFKRVSITRFNFFYNYRCPLKSSIQTPVAAVSIFKF